MRTFITAAIAAYAAAQQVGHQKQEYHPKLSLGTCTKDHGCQSEDKEVTLDANWRWTHKVGTYSNCYTGTSWDTSVCSDPLTCAKNCAIDGVDETDMKGTYGISSDGHGLRLNFVTQQQYGKNVGSRTYMMQDESNYEMFKLKNKEFTFDVDVSQLPCGINGALYFVEMPQNGDMGENNNAAGAKYGTGYCDAQCPHDIKFIKGKANITDWNTTTAMGGHGICCAEMDIWEANSTAEAYTLHPCGNENSYECTDPVTCGDGTDHRYDGICDKDGCDFNPYRAGVKDFFGAGMKVDTTAPFTVVTQFITEDGTDESDIVEVRRKFVQNGTVFEHPSTDIPGLDEQYDSITDDMCENVKQVMGDQNDYKKKGGMKKMSDALGRGMVLVMSLWDDHAAQMLWLDSTYPTDKTTIGGPRGPCPTTSGNPDQVEQQSPDAYVKYMNIRVGEIDSTYKPSEFLQ